MIEGVYNRLCREETLLKGWERVRRKGAAGGVDGLSVEQIEVNLEGYIRNLAEKLCTGRYIPEPCEEVLVPKSSGNHEKRKLALPTVMDKILQVAVVDLIGPQFEASFLNCSYAYRKGKGPARAIARVNDYLLRKKKWLALCDIDDFFDCVQHSVLEGLLRDRIDDERMMGLLTLWIRMGRYDVRKGWRETEKGIAQGGVISPLLANIYLHPFDEYMTGKGYGLVRYSDDFVILNNTRREAESALLDAESFLSSRLRLRLNPEKEVRHADHGFIFLGVHFYGGVKRISEKKRQKIHAKLQTLLSAGEGKPLEKVLEKLNEEMAGWRRYYGKVCAPADLERIDLDVAEMLVRLIRRQREKKLLGTRKEALLVLEELQFTSPAYLLTKRKRTRDIVKRAFLPANDVEHYKEVAAARNVSGRVHQRPPDKLQDGKVSGSTDPALSISVQRRKYEKKYSEMHDLVVSTPGVFLGKRGRHIVVRRGRKNLRKVSTLNLRNITILSSGVAFSSDVVRFCSGQGITIHFLAYNGKPYASIVAPEASHTATGLLQLKAVGNEKGKKLACSIVKGKVRNQINLVKYYLKYRKDRDPDYVNACRIALEDMEERVNELKFLTLGKDYDLFRNRLFSIEGRASSSYWDAVTVLLDDDVVFPGRKRRGANDLVNSLLNYGYGVLYARIWGAVTTAGLNPCISFLHKEQPGKPTLVYDLIEEFRQQAVDRPVFAMITKGEPLVMEKQLLTKETRSRVVENVLERLHVKIPFRGGRKSLEEIIRHQARAVVKFIKGESKTYRPFIAKW